MSQTPTPPKNGASERRKTSVLQDLYAFLASLRLSVILLALSTLLVFLGTLDQVNIGIRGAQTKYFESIIAFWSYPADWAGGEILSWLALPIPGGYLLGPLLVINLVCAHFRHFRLKLSALGNSVVHGGIVLLLLGQLYAQVFQKEGFLWVSEGQSSNYLQSFHADELVVIDKSNPDFDQVVSIPFSQIRDGASFQHPELPFRLNILDAFPNAQIQSARGARGGTAANVNRGLGQRFNLQVTEEPRVPDDDARNLASAIVEVVGPEGSQGVWLLSNVFEDQFPPQFFAYNDRVYQMAVRFKRSYLPYSIELIDFMHEQYEGTRIPRSFSSRVRLHDPRNGEERAALISMNNPLRYDGLTFFQASFGEGDTASMFQVVENPGWLIPYISCLLVSVGLTWQFGLALIKFRRRKTS